MEELNITPTVDYGDSNIITLEGLEHVRRRNQPVVYCLILP
jgi:DNA gyrase/topoisomerase IV subunit B